MKTGIIGLPQVGKTSLFKILTKAKTESFGHSNLARRISASPAFPTPAWTSSAALAKTRKTVYATVEYADLSAIGEEAPRKPPSCRAYATSIHHPVLRAFEDDPSPTSAPSIRCATSATSR